MNSTLPIALIVIAVITAIVAALIIISKRNSRAQRTAMREAYQQLLSKFNIKPAVEEEFTNRIIGLDTSKKLFVAFLPTTDKGHEVVDLREVTDCKVRKEGLTVSRSTKVGRPAPDEYINGLSLSLLLRNGTAVDVPVYNEMVDGLEEKIRLCGVADNWAQRIRSSLG